MKTNKFIVNKLAVTGAFGIILACATLTGITTTLNLMAEDGMENVQQASYKAPTIILSQIDKYNDDILRVVYIEGDVNCNDLLLRIDDTKVDLGDDDLELGSIINISKLIDDNSIIVGPEYDVTMALITSINQLVCTHTFDNEQVNQPPVANDDYYEVFMNSEDNIFRVVEENDYDVEDGLPALVDITYQPAGGVATIVDDLTIVFTPYAGWSGECDFEYLVNDSAGDDDSAIVTIQVLENTPPIANDDSYTVYANSSMNYFDVLENDFDLEDGKPDITWYQTPSNGTLTPIIENHTLAYTPNPGYTGVDSFQYTVWDSGLLTDDAIVNITILAENTPPIANADSYEVVENSFVELTMLANDTDAEDGSPTFADYVTFPNFGTIEISDGGETIVYIPWHGYTGKDSFIYMVIDSGSLTDTATVNITVLPENTPPIANDDSYEVDQDSTNNPFDIVEPNDTDEEDILPALSKIVTPPLNGVAVKVDDLTIVYTPNPGFSGLDSFVYEVVDSGGLKDTATVNITVIPENTPPVANDDYYTVDQDSTNNPFDIVEPNDTDEEDILPALSKIVTPPVNGVAKKVDDLMIAYTPNPGFSGVDSFVYEVVDSGGLTDTATVHITVTAGEKEGDPPLPKK